MRQALLLALAASACGSKSDPPAAASRDAATPAVVIDARIVTADAIVATAPDAERPRPSARCAGLPRGAEVDVLPTHDGVRTFHVHAGDDRWLVFDRPEACHVSRVARADARADGAFWPGVADARAFVLAGEPCEVDADEHLIGCVAVVGVREASGAMIDAVETCSGSMPPGIHGAQIFSDLDSLIVSCPGFTGFGLDEELALVHAVDGALRVVLDVQGSWGDHAPGDACVACKRHCWNELDAAHWRVLQRGATPRLQTQAPLAYPWGGGSDEAAYERERAASKNQLQWRFDPGKRVFVVEQRKHVDTAAKHDACAPYPLGSPLD